MKIEENSTGTSVEASSTNNDDCEFNQAARAEAVQGKYNQLFDEREDSEEWAWTPKLYSGKEEDEKKDEDIFSSLQEEISELDDLRKGSGGSYKARGTAKTSNSGSKDRIAEKKKNIEVRSVDGYQGREKEVIVFSTVRSNRFGRVGFLKDWRRLNVALTRARNGIIVIGDANTLRYERNWRAFIAWCKTNHVFVRKK